MTHVRNAPIALASCILSLIACPASIVNANTENFVTPTVDLFPECVEWADRGDCKPGGRPYFMQKNCPVSCHKKTHKEPEHRRIDDDAQEEFYELTANTAAGKALSMENFEGYITVLVNAARVCEASDIFYDSLEHMHSIHPYALEILAFPFEHPGINLDACRETILAEEKKEGRKIHVMETIQTNGPNTHPIFRFLKKTFDLNELDPNVSNYFFVNPDGTLIEHHHGASYKTLKLFVDKFMHYYDDRA